MLRALQSDADAWHDYTFTTVEGVDGRGRITKTTPPSYRPGMKHTQMVSRRDGAYINRNGTEMEFAPSHSFPWCATVAAALACAAWTVVYTRLLSWHGSEWWGRSRGSGFRDLREMCPLFGYTLPPMSFAVLKTFLIFHVFRMLSTPAPTGSRESQWLNVAKLCIVVYQCGAALWFLVTVVSIHADAGYNALAWLTLSSSGSLSLMTTAVQFFVSERFSNGVHPEARERFEHRRVLSRFRSCSPKDWLLSPVIPRRVPEVMCAVCVAPFAAFLLTHALVGTCLFAWPLIILVPLAERAGLVRNGVNREALREYFMAPVILLACLFAFYTMARGVVLFLADSTACRVDWGCPDNATAYVSEWAPSVGPGALFCNCTLFCIIPALIIARVTRARLRPGFVATQTCAARCLRLVFGRDAVDAFFFDQAGAGTVFFYKALRTFLVVVFFQSSATYAQLWYEGVPYWDIVPMEWEHRSYGVYLPCLNAKVLRIFHQGEADMATAENATLHNMRLAWADFAGIF